MFAHAYGLKVVLFLAFALYAALIVCSRAHHTGSSRWPAFCKSFFWRSPFNYFEMKLATDATLPEGRKYVFGCAPHGIHGFFLSMLTYEGDSSPFYRRFPHLRGRLVGLVATVLFKIPLVRELFLWSGYVDAGRHTALKMLRKDGQHLYFLTGGEAESLVSHPGTDRVVLAGRGRHGFVRLALEAGALLVPVYAFHNSDTYDTNTVFLSSLRKWLSKRFRVCFPLFSGRWLTPVPFNVQITVAVGDPVPAPPPCAADADSSAVQARIEQYHAAYISALESLFERYKLAAGYPPERRLEVLHA
jgi:hypothetical protein